MLSCPSSHRFPIRRSIPRFNLRHTQRGRTKRTFDVEWTVFRYDEKIYGHSRQEELHDFFLRSRVNEAFLAGKTILDAGCGTGRLTQSVGRLAREVVGLDFSEGVEEAWFRNREEANVHVIQADLMNLPFRGASFDYVYCKGVLHYVPDVRACLSGLAMQVRQGGALSVTIYPRMSPRFERFNDLLRGVSASLPVSALYGLSHLLIPFLSVAWRWSGLTRRRIEWRESAHMIFNWLSSEHQNRASNETMEKWFRELGFDRIRLSELPVGITGDRVA
jgi:ubiquinone/menaquinone biosynthesis C-methylase UbiE